MIIFTLEITCKYKKIDPSQSTFLIIRFKILTFLSNVLLRVYPFLFLFLVFGSLIMGPLFVINTPQISFNIVSKALAEESTDDGSTDSGQDDEEESDDQTDEQTDDQTDEQTDEQSEQSDSDEQTDDDAEDKEATQNEETSDSVTDASEPTVLDVILKDDSLLKEVVDDNATESGLVSALTVIQEEQDQPGAETCGNAIDDDSDGTIDENCPPLTSAPAETCGNAIDDDSDGTIDEEDCVVPPTEICDNQIDDDVDGKTDEADEDDCSTVHPAVVIESAEDEEGEPLSRGDNIPPGEVTFTFSARTNETSLDSQGNSHDYKFECALDGKSFNSCNSPETVKLDDGKYTFVVRLTS